MVANLETPQSRAPCPRLVEPTTKEALQTTVGEGIIEQSVRRRVARGLQSTSSERTYVGPQTTPVGSTLRGSIVVRAPRVAHPSKGIVAPTGTSVGAHHAESLFGGALQSSSPQSPTLHVDVARAIVLQRTSTHAVGSASSRQGPQTSRQTEGGRSACRG